MTALEEVIVTTRRREERLQDVLVSMAAFTGAILRGQSIFSASDIATSIPVPARRSPLRLGEYDVCNPRFFQELRTTSSVPNYWLDNSRRFDLIICSFNNKDLKEEAIEVFSSQKSFVSEGCDAVFYMDALSQQVSFDNLTQLAGRNTALMILGVNYEPIPIPLKLICYNNWRI